MWFWVILRTAKKQICRHSKGWWNQDLSRLSQEFNKAKRRFAKRSDEANERKLVEVLNAFKEEEVRARNQYLEEMVKLMVVLFDYGIFIIDHRK